MEHADRVLEDEQMVAAVYEALAKRHPKSRGRGRLGAPAEMVLRMPRWWRPISTNRPTAACWETGCGC
jgi:hypothetical protein